MHMTVAEICTKQTYYEVCTNKYLMYIASGIIHSCCLPGSLAKDLLILDSINLSKTSMLLNWQLHALQELSLWPEVAAGQKSSNLN